MSLQILYGSQGGSAEEVARRVGREAYCRGYDYTVAAMDEYDISALGEARLVVFVCSTTGEGEEPENMKAFWKFLLRKDLPAGCLSGLRFAVLGLGDSSYELFNYAGKRLFRRLLQLGGTPLCPRADADDQDRFGVEGALGPFLQNLWPAIQSLPTPIAGRGPRELPPLAKLVPVDASPMPMASQAFNATVGKSKRITSASQQVKEVRHLILETDLAHRPGDVAIVWPENSDEDVEELLGQLEWSPFAHQLFTIKGNRPDFTFPRKPSPRSISLFALIKTYLDINRVPSRYFFTVCSKHVDRDHLLGPLHAEKLAELGDTDTSAEGLESYLDYVWRPKRRPIDIVRDFSSLRLPLESIFDLFPWIKPRSFSIASCRRGEVHLTLAVARFNTVLRKERLGLCSRWLTELRIGERLNIAIKPGSMHLICDDSPVVLLCAGTGIAPMRAFIDKIASLQPDAPRQVFLFFGCRSVTKDALFMDDFQAFVDAGWLSVFVEGSRDQPHKIYLQDIVKKHSNILVPLLLNARCHFYLSGNSKLPAAVKKSIRDIITCALEEDASAKALLMAFFQSRFHSETWS